MDTPELEHERTGVEDLWRTGMVHSQQAVHGIVDIWKCPLMISISTTLGAGEFGRDGIRIFESGSEKHCSKLEA